MLKRLAEFSAGQWDDRDTVAARQKTRLAELLGHALAEIPFYRERVSAMSSAAIDASPFEALASFPPLEKNHLVEEFERLHTDLGRGRFINSSGGSTGRPVRVMQDDTYQAAAHATSILFYEWAGMRRGERHVKLWGAPRDLGTGRSAARGRLADALGNRITLDAFNMGPSEMVRYAHVINRFRPICLEGYADALYEFAGWVEREHVPITPPRTIVASATTLLPMMRQKIESVLGSPVFDRYGTREVGNVAAECERHSGLHVFTETTVVEIVDADNCEVDVGEEGEILVTNLWNFTMPLIRYRIGDRAVRGDDRCACGRPYPLLERISGRSQSCFLRPDGGIVLPEFFIHLIGVEFNDGFIETFQVIQDTHSSITVRIVPLADREDEAFSRQKEIAARIQEAMGAPCDVHFVLEDEIAPTATGKHLYTLSKVARASH